MGGLLFSFSFFYFGLGKGEGEFGIFFGASIIKLYITATGALNDLNQNFTDLHDTKFIVIFNLTQNFRRELVISRIMPCP